MSDQDRYEYEVSREQWEEDQRKDSEELERKSASDFVQALMASYDRGHLDCLRGLVEAAQEKRLTVIPLEALESLLEDKKRATH